MRSVGLDDRGVKAFAQAVTLVSDRAAAYARGVRIRRLPLSRLHSPKRVVDDSGAAPGRASWRAIGVGALLLCVAPAASAQGASAENEPAREDTRTQVPGWLVDSYVGANLGWIQYDFTQRQLEPGFRAATIETPHAGARVALFGHHFNRFLSAQLTYMRPVLYVSYVDINGDRAGHHLFAHFGGVTLRPSAPVTPRVSLFGEVGIGVTSRRALTINGVPAVREAQFASAVFGGGVLYHVTRAWDLTAGITGSPGRPRDRQPRTLFWSGGVQYTVRPLSAARVRASRQAGAIFPEHLIQLDVTTGVGYGVNDFVSRKIPIFWRGNVKVARGFALHYERNVFHTRKLFALDLGASVSVWRSRDNRDPFVAVSVYPLLRFTPLRFRAADVYVCYSLAGPSYVSRDVIDHQDTGNHFTFQDFLGVGAFIGRNRHLSAGVKINHYSNGNIFTKNAGIRVPVTVTAGYAF